MLDHSYLRISVRHSVLESMTCMFGVLQESTLEFPTVLDLVGARSDCGFDFVIQLAKYRPLIQA